MKTTHRDDPAAKLGVVVLAAAAVVALALGAGAGPLAAVFAVLCIYAKLTGPRPGGGPP